MIRFTQVPFFGDIPLLGWLFKSKEFKDNKTELLIFITPRILAQQAEPALRRAALPAAASPAA